MLIIDSFEHEIDDGKKDRFLDFGEVSETYLEAGEEKLEYIASRICATSSQKLQLKAQIREYQKAQDFNGFYIRKEWDLKYIIFISSRKTNMSKQPM